MNDELREVMCQALTRHWHGPDADMHDLEGECECLEEAGVMLAAIEQAGFVIVHRDRWDRVAAMARVFADSRVVGPSGDVGSVDELLLQPGDLEASEGFTLIRAASQTALLSDFNPDEYPLHGDLVEGGA